jgi:hypothetical protein
VGGTAGGTAFLLTSSGGTAKDIKGADLGGSSCKKIIKMISAKAYLVLLLSSMMVNANDFLYCYNFKVVGNGKSEIKIPGHSYTKNDRAEATINLNWDGIYTVGDKYSVTSIEEPIKKKEKAVAVGPNELRVAQIAIDWSFWWLQTHTFHCRELTAKDIKDMELTKYLPPDLVMDIFQDVLGLDRQNARFYAYTEHKHFWQRRLTIKDGDLCKVRGTHICNGQCQVNTNKCFPFGQVFKQGESCKGETMNGQTEYLTCAKDLVCNPFKDYKCVVCVPLGNGRCRLT